MFRLVVLCTVAALAVGGRARAEGAWVKSGAYGSFQVVMADGASDSVRLAAEEFIGYWRQATGYDAPVGTRPGTGVNVWIGQEGVPTGFLEQVDLEGLGDDGLCLKTVSPRDLLIVGGSGRGTLYGVYEFLERYMGVRWLTPDLTHIPELPPASLPEIDYRFVPVFEYRYSTYIWRDIHRNDETLKFRRRQRWVEGPGFSCHTFYSYVPPKEYYPEHPEYFSEVDGKRIAPWDFNWHDVNTLGERREQRGQLCMTNPDVIRIIGDKIAEQIRANPNRKSYHVSQMDWFNYCECEKCAAIDEREESHAGATLWGLNQIAERIGNEFPGYQIETLAYQYTRKPPKHLKPRDNLAIKLCSIECDFGTPLDDRDSDINRQFADDIRKWAKIANRLHVWDYTHNFRNFQTPHPNFHVLQPNLQFFAEHNVKGMFEQGCNDRGGEFAYLRTYLISKLMWDPYADAEAIKNEFIDLYYQAAAPFIKDYLQLVADTAQQKDAVIGCFQDGNWIDYGFVEKAEAIFSEAFAAVSSDELRQRVDAAHIPVQYAALVCAPRSRVEEGRFIIERPPSLSLEEYAEKLKRFGVVNVIDFFPFELFYDQIGGKTPPRRAESPLEILENEHVALWVTPAFNGAVIRWRDKKHGVELLRGYKHYSQLPTIWREYTHTPPIGQPIADAFTVTEQTPTAIAIHATTDGGLTVTKRLRLSGDSNEVEFSLTIHNPTAEPVVPLIKTVPEFYTQGPVHPEVWTELDGAWSQMNPR